LFGKSEKKKPLGKHTCRWENNIRTSLQEMGWSVYWVYVAQVRDKAVAQWLRCCATNRKVAGSIPDGVIGIFH
jgi:hypothetical protein